MTRFSTILIKSEPERIDTGIQFLTVSRCLERIAEHTANIAEDVMNMIDGEIGRHCN